MKHDRSALLVALAGQPNCGKSAVFNMLTGARQHVANYPGVTVDKKWGSYVSDEHKVEVVDLPGTYSLTSYSQEEKIARNSILLEHPDVLVADQLGITVCRFQPHVTYLREKAGFSAMTYFVASL